MNVYGAIDAIDEAVNNFYIFSLHLYHIHSKKMWNHMEINWHLVALFVMQYIYIPDGINNYFMLRYTKNKKV